MGLVIYFDLNVVFEALKCEYSEKIAFFITTNVSKKFYHTQKNLFYFIFPQIFTNLF